MNGTGVSRHHVQVDPETRASTRGAGVTIASLSPNRAATGDADAGSKSTGRAATMRGNLGLANADRACAIERRDRVASAWPPAEARSEWSAGASRLGEDEPEDAATTSPKRRVAGTPRDARRRRRRRRHGQRGAAAKRWSRSSGEGRRRGPRRREREVGEIAKVGTIAAWRAKRRSGPTSTDGRRRARGGGDRVGAEPRTRSCRNEHGAAGTPYRSRDVGVAVEAVGRRGVESVIGYQGRGTGCCRDASVAEERGDELLGVELDEVADALADADDLHRDARARTGSRARCRPWRCRRAW